MNATCAMHPELPAAANCSECQRPLCVTCTQHVAGKPVCASCVNAIRQRVAAELNANPLHGQAVAAPPPPVSAVPLNAGAQPSAIPVNAPSAIPMNTPSAIPMNAPRGPQAMPGAPAMPGYGVPAQPGYAQPTQPGYAPQGQPTYGAPGTPLAGTPGYAPNPNPGYAQPSQPGSYMPPAGGQMPYGAPQPGAYGQPGGGLPQMPNPGTVYAPSRPYAAQDDEIPGAKHLIMGTIFGLIAAFVCAILWWKVAEATHMVLAYAALGVGTAVGFAVMMGAKEAGVPPALLGAGLTLLSITLGQYLLAYNNGNPSPTLAEMFAFRTPIGYCIVIFGVYIGFKVPYNGSMRNN